MSRYHMLHVQNEFTIFAIFWPILLWTIPSFLSRQQTEQIVKLPNVDVPAFAGERLTKNKSDYRETASKQFLSISTSTCVAHT